MVVSVIMPVRNGERFVAEAVESILEQTYTDFIFIIIDDASTDASAKILQSYAKKDKRIYLHRNQRPQGIVKTRNKGFNLLPKDTTYIALFDADDISAPNRLERQVAFLDKNPTIGAVGSDILIINEKSELIASRTYHHHPKQIAKHLLIRSPFAQPAVCLRKEVLTTVGVYTSENGHDRARDYDLWLRIARKYPLANIDAFLLSYRVSDHQGKKTHLKETIRSTLQVKRKYLFKSQYFRCIAVVVFLLEYILLLFPSKFILWLFKKLMYKKVNNDK